MRLKNFLNEKEYFVGSFIIKDNEGKEHTVKLTRSEKKMAAPVNLYIDGELVDQVKGGKKVAMKVAKKKVNEVAAHIPSFQPRKNWKMDPRLKGKKVKVKATGEIAKLTGKYGKKGPLKMFSVIRADGEMQALPADQLIFEKYAFRIGMDLEVFENPTPKDFREIGSDEIRFIALHDKKKVYAWDAYQLLHADVSQKLRPPTDWETDPNRLEGMAIIKSGKAKAVKSDQLLCLSGQGPSNFYTSEELFREVMNRDWSWVNRYINIKDLIKKYERRL